MKQTMKNLPISDRPFDKFKEVGSQALSDRELLTILIRSGGKKDRADEIAQRVVEFCGAEGLKRLVSCSQEELKAIPGIGEVKAIQLLTAAEIAKRITDVKRPFGNHYKTPGEIAEYYLPRFRYQTKEHLMLLFLDVKNKVKKEEIISIGSVKMALCEPRDIFMAALRSGAASMVILHNHPSGDAKPSDKDIDVTAELVYLGKMLGIPVLDHIILGYDTYYSLRENDRVKF